MTLFQWPDEKKKKVRILSTNRRLSKPSITIPPTNRVKNYEGGTGPVSKYVCIYLPRVWVE